MKDTNINELSNTSITTTIYSSTSTHTKYSFKKIKLFIDSDAFYLSSNGCEETLRIHFTDGSLSTVKGKVEWMHDAAERKVGGEEFKVLTTHKITQ